MNGVKRMDADLSYLVLTCSAQHTQTVKDGGEWAEGQGHGHSGSSEWADVGWATGRRRGPLVIKGREGGKVDSLGCRQDSHKISGGSALCLVALATWGGPVGG